jgi:hypothetical protein
MVFLCVDQVVQGNRDALCGTRIRNRIDPIACGQLDIVTLVDIDSKHFTVCHMNKGRTELSPCSWPSARLLIQVLMTNEELITGETSSRHAHDKDYSERHLYPVETGLGGCHYVTEPTCLAPR